MYTHINDRSDLDQHVAYDPRTKHHTTRREDLERRDGHRTDVVLLNGCRSGREYTLHVDIDGFSGDLWILDILTDAQYYEVLGIAERMRNNCHAFPPARKLVSGW